jgi:hypothetical protein
MTTKLTLSLEKETIEKAKVYAKATGRSLSDLVEGYLEKLVQEEHDLNDDKPSASLQQLIGAVKVPPDYDFEAERFRYLSEKYK